jgi:hypothetical protein
VEGVEAFPLPLREVAGLRGELLGVADLPFLAAERGGIRFDEVRRREREEATLLLFLPAYNHAAHQEVH